MYRYNTIQYNSANGCKLVRKRLQQHTYPNTEMAYAKVKSNNNNKDMPVTKQMKLNSKFLLTSLRPVFFWLIIACLGFFMYSITVFVVVFITGYSVVFI